MHTQTITALKTQHPTDSGWWGQITLDPAGKTQVHVRVTGAGHRNPRDQVESASLPFVELDELQELIDRARQRCAASGFVT